MGSRNAMGLGYGSNISEMYMPNFDSKDFWVFELKLAGQHYSEEQLMQDAWIPIQLNHVWQGLRWPVVPFCILDSYQSEAWIIRINYVNLIICSVSRIYTRFLSLKPLCETAKKNTGWLYYVPPKNILWNTRDRFFSFFFPAPFPALCRRSRCWARPQRYISTGQCTGSSECLTSWWFRRQPTCTFRCSTAWSSLPPTRYSSI